MTENTAKNLVGRDLINCREALKRARGYVEAQSDSTYASELLMRIDTLIHRHVDPELDVAKMWAAGDYGEYPKCNQSLGTYVNHKCSKGTVGCTSSHGDGI